MENLNFLPIIVAALIPMAVGALWYGPLFEKAWMDSIGFTKKDLEGANMAKIIGISLLLAFVLAFFINANIELSHKDVVDGALVYGSHHTFGHGALHGAMTALVIVTPVIIINGMFERKKWSNMLIHIGYWVVTFGLIGGLTDMWN